MTLAGVIALFVALLGSGVVAALMDEADGVSQLLHVVAIATIAALWGGASYVMLAA